MNQELNGLWILLSQRLTIQTRHIVVCYHIKELTYYLPIGEISIHLLSHSQELEEVRVTPVVTTTSVPIGRLPFNLFW